MSNYNSYSSSEQLTALLDGELDGGDAGTLFLEMANNPELQSELVHQVSLRNSIQNGLVEPPAHLKAGIIQSIGLGEGVAAAGIGAGLGASASAGFLTSIKQFAASKTAAMLGSAFLATLLTSLLFVSNLADKPAENFADFGAGGGNVALADNLGGTDFDASLMVAAHNSGGDIDLARSLTLEQILSAEAGYAQARANQSANLAAAGLNSDGWNPQNSGTNVLGQNGNSSKYSSDPLDSDPLHGSASISDLIVRALEQHPKEPAAFRSIVVGDVNYNSNLTGMGQGRQTSVSYLKPDDLGLEIQMRGFSAHNFTEIDLQPDREPVLNNISLSMLLAMDANWSYGIEVGQESFNQSFTEETRTGTMLHEQRYVGFWGAAALQYRTLPVESLADMQFFSRLAVGGTEQGPVGRLMLGAEYAFDARLAMIAGIEASALYYTFQSSDHFSNKLAFSYGLSFKL